MLIFNRDGFKAGTTLVKEPQDKTKKDGAMKIYLLKVSDQGKEMAFIDEDYVLAHYPTLFKKA